ncbi:MAG: hypothetical protein KKH22_03850 [Proteobacteria bacterium]|nr:hypothetical protein [Pseudomonadota bacterium]
MKRFLIGAAIAAASFATPALATDVGVSVSIGQPGFYGHIDIGDFPQPRVIYSKPRIILRGVSMNRPPLYLRVPPGHIKHWEKHCREYKACGERVFFVHDDWYEQEYVPRYQEKHRERHDDRRDDHHGDERDDDHGKSKNKGKGNGKDKDKGHGHDR